MRRSTVLLWMLFGCATVGERPVPSSALSVTPSVREIECKLACERAYGKPMPDAHLDVGNACTCIPGCVLLTAKLKAVTTVK